MKGWLKGWMNEWMNEWMDDWLTCLTGEYIKMNSNIFLLTLQSINQSINESINESINQSVGRLIKQVFKSIRHYITNSINQNKINQSINQKIKIMSMSILPVKSEAYVLHDPLGSWGWKCTLNQRLQPCLQTSNRQYISSRASWSYSSLCQVFIHFF